MNEENNRDGNDVEDVPAEPLPALESLDDYIRRYGLRHGNGGKFDGIHATRSHFYFEMPHPQMQFLLISSCSVPSQMNRLVGNSWV